jgi:hypothetical protein
MSTAGTSWGVIAKFMCPLSENFGSLKLLDSYGPVQAPIGIDLLSMYFILSFKFVYFNA